jgi:nitrogen fixation protein NifU and related proteins
VSDLRELYQSVILDHNRAPRNYGPLPDATAHADGRNPLCGDGVTVWIKVAGERIEEVRFVGVGCAISKASASLMTTVVKGQTRSAAVALADRFQAVVTGGADHAQDLADDAALRRLAPLAGISQFPQRVKCATMAWHALRAALVLADAGEHPAEADRSSGAVQP